MLFDPAFLQNPYPELNALREAGPIHPLPMLGGAWALTRHADVSLLLRDPRFSARRAHTLANPFSPAERQELAPFIGLFSEWMLFYDPPGHTGIRRPFGPMFGAEAIGRWRGLIEAIADKLADAAAEQGAMDAIRDFAHPLPAMAICALLGLPAEDVPLLIGWSNDIARFFDGSAVAIESARLAQTSLIDLTRYLERQVEAHPAADDLIAQLKAIEQQGAFTSRDQLVAQCAMLLFAGHETTRNLIGNGLLALLENPAQFRRLRADVSCYRTVPDELLRYDSPVQLGTRIALEDIAVHDHVIRAGDLVLFLFGSANRDPREFVRPDELDVARYPNRQVSFSFGIHSCLGAGLARMECEAALRALISRFPNLELAAPTVEWQPTFGFRGLRALPVRFAARRASGRPDDRTRMAAAR